MKRRDRRIAEGAHFYVIPSSEAERLAPEVLRGGVERVYILQPPPATGTHPYPGYPRPPEKTAASPLSSVPTAMAAFAASVAAIAGLVNTTNSSTGLFALVLASSAVGLGISAVVLFKRRQVTTGLYITHNKLHTYQTWHYPTRARLAATAVALISLISLAVVTITRLL